MILTADDKQKLIFHVSRRHGRIFALARVRIRAPQVEHVVASAQKE